MIAFAADRPRLFYTATFVTGLGGGIITALI